MTKEQIKAKAKEQFPNDEFKQQIVIDAINWATKELQKQIEIDAKQIRALQKQNGELTDKVKELEAQINRAFDVLAFKRKRIAELEAQIEKMKCCGNCKFYNNKYFRCEKTLLTLKSGLCHNFDKWEIKER